MGMLNIALLQIAPCAALKENLEKGMEACKKAKETGPTLRYSLKCGAMATTSTAGPPTSGRGRRFRQMGNL